MKCKYLIDEVCCNADCELVADFPDYRSCNSKEDCEFYEEKK